jgi:hypothetical protein
MCAELVICLLLYVQQDVLAPTRLSLACVTSKKREKDNRMAEHDRSAVWDEVLEEADELDHVHKDPRSVSFLSGGTTKSMSLHLLLYLLCRLCSFYEWRRTLIRECFLA